MTDLLPPLALYVHFPWCVRKCPYCDFNSYALQGELPQEPYLARLAQDLAQQAPLVAGREVESVFLGGGTPSLFPAEAIAQVLQTARGLLRFAADAEVTLEANPGTVERGAFAEYRAAGVNRVSLGAQSFAARTLVALGRIHSPAETCRAAEELHAAGLGNFNLDLMYALPGQDVAAAVGDVEHALALQPAHVSHYQLTLEPGTLFAAQPPPLPDEDSAAQMLGECGARLAARGFRRYEVSAYAVGAARCRHNLNYWNFGDYLGIGAGAHGKLTLAQGIVRTTQWREPRRYLAGGVAQQSPVPAEQLPFEFMLNALRLVDGFAVATYEQRTGLPWSALQPQLAHLRARGLIEMTPAGCRPSARGLSFLNDLLLEFLPQTPQKTAVSAMSTATAEVLAGPS
jgi:putative oxygen-independent coproporphyrinogen III oxidase